MNTPRQHIELFHLLFLEQLARNMDHKLYAVKGGCNLRFFLKSIRYSEDLDIDVHTIAVQTLKDKVNRILNSKPFGHILAAQGLSITQISSPKQTGTTQRWKLSLRVNTPLPLNTKIEFSRRVMQDKVIYEPIDPEIVRHYHLRSLFCPHYDKTAALVQKIEALAGRPQTQARDVFDLFWLITTGKINNVNFLDNSLIAAAIQNMLAIRFEDFKSQVVAFLDPADQLPYDSITMWEHIVTQVLEQLEALK